MMGSGTLSIDVRTLRVLLPLWMRSAGFVVDDSRMADTNMMAVDCEVPTFGHREAEGYLTSMLRGLTVVDGGVWHRYDDRQKALFIKVAYGEEEDSDVR